MKLNKINSQRLTEKEMNSLKGGASEKPAGASCGCGCASENNGGSNISNNGMANAASGLVSPGVIIKRWYTYVNVPVDSKP